jgi:hypothetical protein
MANVVVLGGVIKCSHGGKVSLSSGDGRLDVDSKNVVLQGQETGVSFAVGTPMCPVQTPSGAPSPCTAMAATSGVSAKITVGGLGALLDTAQGKATNAQDPSATWSIDDAGQNKLQSDG